MPVPPTPIRASVGAPSAPPSADADGRLTFDSALREPRIWRHAGNADLWTAAWVSADAVIRGIPLHLHAEGPRGTGKTTVLRALGRTLPPLTRVRACPYNCDPAAPHCPLHRDLSPAELRALGSEEVPTPFLELSASAKLGTAVGTIDLARLLDPARPEAALLPGTIARAHRGVLFVDEINRLADVAPELADALLDVMGQKPGRLQIEEAGLPPVVLPVSVTVWAASNPDEEPGPLEHTRLQLADRFDLRVRVDPPAETSVVLAILRDSAGGGRGGGGGGEGRGATPPSARTPGAARPSAEEGERDGRHFEPPQCGGQKDIAFPDTLLHDMADFYVRAGLGSLRALHAWRLAAEGLARRAGRAAVRAEDVRAAARLALRGRMDAEAVESGLRGIGGEDADGRRDTAATAEGPAQGPEAEVAGAAPRTARPIAEVRPLVRPEWRGEEE